MKTLKGLKVTIIHPLGVLPLTRPSATRRGAAILAALCLVLSVFSGAALPAANARHVASTNAATPTPGPVTAPAPAPSPAPTPKWKAPNPHKISKLKPAPSLGPRPVKRGGWSCAHFAQSCTAVSTSWLGGIDVTPAIVHVGDTVTAHAHLTGGSPTNVWPDGWEIGGVGVKQAGVTDVEGCGTTQPSKDDLKMIEAGGKKAAEVADKDYSCSWKVTSPTNAWVVVTVSWANTIGYAESQDSYAVVGNRVHALDGYVTSTDSKATGVPNVTIAIICLEQECTSYSVATNGDGFYNAVLPENTYMVYATQIDFHTDVTLADFLPETATVDLSADRKVNFKLRLCGEQKCVAHYEWEMPKRFGLTNTNGLIDYPSVASDKASGSYQVVPSSWPVTFTVNVDGRCPEDSSEFQLTWTIEETAHIGSRPLVADTGPFTPVSGQPCQFSHAFPEEGIYQVKLTTQIAIASGNYVYAGEWSDKVWVKDWLIVGLGDGFASGDGAPDAGTGAGALWEDAACRRSTNSYQARAALWLENMDRHTSVTFLQLACAGAGWATSYAAPYGGAGPGTGGLTDYSLDGQLRAMKAAIGDRTPDAILISIGVNDVDYGDALAFCSRKSWDWATVTPFAPLTPGQSFTTDCSDTHYPGQTSSRTLFSTAQAGLHGMSPSFNQFFKDLESDGIYASHVYLVEYPDPTTDSNGNTCQKMSFSATEPISGTNQLVTLPGLNDAESDFMSAIVRAVNGSWQKHAEQVGYHYIGGISANFAGHGYCAGDPYVNTAAASQAAQGDPSAATYPTACGYAMMTLPVETALQNDLYPGGVERSHFDE